MPDVEAFGASILDAFEELAALARRDRYAMSA
jgi:hypothetical protein